MEKRSFLILAIGMGIAGIAIGGYSMYVYVSEMLHSIG